MDSTLQRVELAPVPPLFIDQKAVQSNLFSNHDNRHLLQNEGVYLGKSLGRKKLRDPSLTQHYSEDLISWRGQSATSIPYTKSTILSAHRPFTSHSILSSTYTVPNELLHKHHTVTKTHFHRFPYHHLLPLSGVDKPTTQTTCWGKEPSVTPLWVLAATQKPFPKQNTWKYSYKFR